MIITVAELRRYVNTDVEDQVLAAMLQALELSIRKYTNNNFQLRPFRTIATATADGNKLITSGEIRFSAGDTLEISESDLMQGCLVTVESVDGGTITVNEPLYDESSVVITKVKYPDDVKYGVVNMVKWDLQNRDKIGVQSETISRHSVTYFNLDGSNSTIGYPKALVGFLNSYKKARFGKGVIA